MAFAFRRFHTVCRPSSGSRLTAVANVLFCRPGIAVDQRPLQQSHLFRHFRLAGVQVKCLDAFQILTQVAGGDEGGVLVYCLVPAKEG